MSDLVDALEVQIHGAVTLSSAAATRRKLNETIARLTPAQASRLLEKLLTFDGSRLPLDFRRYHRYVRFELLSNLAQRLGKEARERFHVRLTGRGASADATLQKGLRHVFPAGTEALRDRFLRALDKPPGGFPEAFLEFRSHYLQPSSDNQSDVKLRLMPDYLGLDTRNGHGQNWMEIRGTVRNHQPGASYHFSRVIERGIWYRSDSRWDPGPAEQGTIDDNPKEQSDEDTDPENDHIYSVDGPGPSIPPPVAGHSVAEYVYIIDATETLEITFKGHVTFGPSLRWFSVSWLDRAQDGTWQRKLGKNAILQGSIDEVIVKDGHEPKTLSEAINLKRPPRLPHWPF